jgi:hypothetical protein
MVTRSLGAMVPLRPSAEAGMMVGAATAAPRIAAVRRKKRRRVTFIVFEHIWQNLGRPSFFMRKKGLYVWFDATPESRIQTGMEFPFNTPGYEPV